MEPKTVSFSTGGTVQTFNVVHVFNPNRAIIDFGGVFVLVDRNPADGSWDQSPIMARDGDEKTVLKSFEMGTMDRTVVTVTPPEKP